jgi:hypothetical protein
MHDGSLSDFPRDLRAEIASPILRYSDMEDLQKIARAVWAGGSRATKTCGIHVHVGSDSFSVPQICNLAKTVYKYEPLLFPALGVTNHRMNNFCRPVNEQFIEKITAQKPMTMEDLNKLWYGFHNTNPAHYDASRYHGLNLHNVFFRNTVEFRYFEGTLHAGKIKSYIQLVLALSVKAIDGAPPTFDKRSFLPASGRYDFRCFLLNLKMIGGEFKSARLHLLSKLSGDMAFRNGRPQ